MYIANGIAAFLVPLANVLKTAAGSWQSVFLVAAVSNAVVVLLALFVLRLLRPNRMRLVRLAAAHEG